MNERKVYAAAADTHTHRNTLLCVIKYSKAVEILFPTFSSFDSFSYFLVFSQFFFCCSYCVNDSVQIKYIYTHRERERERKGRTESSRIKPRRALSSWSKGNGFTPKVKEMICLRLFYIICIWKSKSSKIKWIASFGCSNGNGNGSGASWNWYAMYEIVKRINMLTHTQTRRVYQHCHHYNSFSQPAQSCWIESRHGSHIHHFHLLFINVWERLWDFRISKNLAKQFKPERERERASQSVSTLPARRRHTHTHNVPPTNLCTDKTVYFVIYLNDMQNMYVRAAIWKS